MRQAFLIPRDKKTKFATLRESILSSSCVSLKTLPRFAGKVVSFSLAIPGCKLYVGEVFHAIAQLSIRVPPRLLLRSKEDFALMSRTGAF